MLVKLSIEGRELEIKLDPYLAEASQALCAREGITLEELCRHVEEERLKQAFATALSHHVIAYNREAAEASLPRGMAEGGERESLEEALQATNMPANANRKVH